MKQTLMIPPAERVDGWRRLPIQIRFNDVDRYGHVNNNSYFSYYDLGKEEYLNNVLTADYFEKDINFFIIGLQNG